MSSSVDDPNGPAVPRGRHAPPPRPGSRSRGLWALITLLLVPPVVLPLLVGLYDRIDPTLWDFPFFFWFQFLLILFSAVMTVIAYYLAKLADRRDREAA